MRFIIIAIAAIAFLSAPASAENGAKWGAIAFGANGNASGTAVDYDSAGEARQAALEACAGQCSQTIVFQRVCGAVAASASGATGSARNRWRNRAIARALAECRRGGSDCTLLAAACIAH
jgi:hypothetical protein